jgi:hypothetical protein
MEKAKGGRPNLSRGTTGFREFLDNEATWSPELKNAKTLTEMGISRDQSSRCGSMPTPAIPMRSTLFGGADCRVPEPILGQPPSPNGGPRQGFPTSGPARQGTLGLRGSIRGALQPKPRAGCRE